MIYRLMPVVLMEEVAGLYTLILESLDENDTPVDACLAQVIVPYESPPLYELRSFVCESYGIPITSAPEQEIYDLKMKTIAAPVVKLNMEWLFSYATTFCTDADFIDAMLTRIVDKGSKEDWRPVHERHVFHVYRDPEYIFIMKDESDD